MINFCTGQKFKFDLTEQSLEWNKNKQQWHTGNSSNDRFSTPQRKRKCISSQYTLDL